jgi:molybdenum cofactor cytidylyltransferase
MIAAIILAAGQSKRMGQPKMLLPWGKLTVIEHVITTFLNAGIEDLVLVTGGTQRQVEQVSEPYPVRRIYNPAYATGEMLSSLQCGLQALSPQVEAVLVALGDQPQIQEGSVRAITGAYRQSGARLVVPSFRRRRGHPWLVARPLWDEILAMQSPESPRDFLNRHAAEIQYVNVDTPSILADLDTPEDYENFHP